MPFADKLLTTSTTALWHVLRSAVSIQTRSKAIRMDNLLERAISAHGGMETWQAFSHITVHLKVEGHIWDIKGKTGVFSDGIFDGDTHRQRSGYRSLVPPFEQSCFEPGKLTFEKPGISEPQVTTDPRKSFAGEALETHWQDFQPHYFGNYAWWTYFTAPFSFTLPGFRVRELSPHLQDKEQWSRLEVTFPDDIETHNKVQVFYFNEHNLLVRHDYAPEILGGITSSQYVKDYRTFDGINIPVTRRIYLRNPDGGYNPEPVMVSLDILDVAFSKSSINQHI